MLSRTRFIRALAGAALLVAMTATPVAAATVVNVSHCSFSLGGTAHIAPDDVTVEIGWGAQTRGLVIAFLRSNTWHLTIDGNAVDVNPYIGTPSLREDGNWWVSALYPAGELGFLDEMFVSVEYELAHPVYDGFDLFRGILGPYDCTIVADVT